MAAIVHLNHPAHTAHWHFFDMSVANIVVIVAMLLVFALSIAMPAPGRLRRRGGSPYERRIYAPFPGRRARRQAFLD